MKLTPPTPPTGDHDDPDAGWYDYEIALGEFEAALVLEKVLATAVQMAIRQDRADLALALLDAEIVGLRLEQGDIGLVTVEIEASVEAFRLLQEENADQGSLDQRFPSRLYRFFEDLLPPDKSLYGIVVRPKLAEVEEGWRDGVRATMAGKASNQGTAFGASSRILHNGLYYRSRTEVKVAEALEQVEGLLFFPNSGAMSHGVHKEPDFLVVYGKKVGILEVDGPTHAGRAADDSVREQLLPDTRDIRQALPRRDVLQATRDDRAELPQAARRELERRPQTGDPLGGADQRVVPGVVTR